MPRPVTSPTTLRTPAPQASAPAAAEDVPVKAVAKGDRLAFSHSGDERLLEADLRFRVVNGPALVANGEIGFSRVFIERLLRHALGKSKTLSNAQVSFDSQKGAYSVRASASVKGVNVPFTVDLKPQVIGQGVGFKLENLRVPLGESGRFGIQHAWITGKVCEELADSLKYSLGARAHRDEGVVTLNPNAILHHVRALPEKLRLDLNQIQLQTAVTGTGDLKLVMRGQGLAPAENRTPDSDLTLDADADGLRALLKGLLSPSYEVGQVTLKDGGGKIGGQAEFKDGSDLVNAGKIMVALIGLAAGDPRGVNFEPSRVMIPLDLDFTLDGTKLKVTPSIGKALGELSKTLEAAGLSPVQDGKSLRVDLADILKARGEVDTLQFKPDGLQLRMKLDLDAFIKNPALKSDG